MTLREASDTLDAFEKVAGSTDATAQPGRPAPRRAAAPDAQLGRRRGRRSLQATLDDARPAARQLSESTLPAAEATLRDLRATSRALRAVTEKIETRARAR